MRRPTEASAARSPNLYNCRDSCQDRKIIFSSSGSDSRSFWRSTKSPARRQSLHLRRSIDIAHHHMAGMLTDETTEITGRATVGKRTSGTRQAAAPSCPDRVSSRSLPMKCTPHITTTGSVSFVPIWASARESPIWSATS